WCDNRGPTAKEAAALADCPALRGLLVLELASCGLDDRSVLALTRGTGFDRLAVLDLSFNPFSDGGAAALAGGPALAAVRKLDLRHTYFGPDGAKALADSPHLGELRALVVSRGSSSETRVLKKRFGSAVRPGW